MGACGNAAALILAASVAAACSTAEDDLRGADPLTSPAGTASSAEPVTSPSAPATGGIDCEAVRQAREALADAVRTTLDDLGLGANSPEAFAVTVIVTAQESPSYWRTALTTVPPQLQAPAERVRSHWAGLAAELSAVTLPDADPASLRRARDAVRDLTGDQGAVAEDESALQAHLDAACPPEGDAG